MARVFERFKSESLSRLQEPFVSFIVQGDLFLHAHALRRSRALAPAAMTAGVTAELAGIAVRAGMFFHGMPPA